LGCRLFGQQTLLSTLPSTARPDGSVELFAWGGFFLVRPKDAQPHQVLTTSHGSMTVLQLERMPAAQ
jgi:hypothetical protein